MTHEKDRGGRGKRQGRSAISPESIVVAAEQQLSSLVGDETVILQLEHGVYYGLDSVGTSIWSLLQQPRSVSEIRDRILDEYDVDAERCERDLIVLLEHLVAENLVQLPPPVGVET